MGILKGLLRPFLLGLLLSLLLLGAPSVLAQAAPLDLEETQEATSFTEAATVQEEKSDIVQSPRERLGELEIALRFQDPGSLWANPLKHAIRGASEAGVSLETIVLLVLFPVVASLIAGARHLIGVRGFGIFLPAALSVVFLAIGPVFGVGLFLVIVIVSSVFRWLMRRIKFRLQYLPRMALILWLVVLSVLGVLFAAPLMGQPDLLEISLFPILILVLLSEDFTRVQLGKSVGVAIGLTSETLFLALISFTILSLRPVQYFALLNPELVLLIAAVFNIIIGRYVGLRLLEYWRFRKLIRSSG